MHLQIGQLLDGKYRISRIIGEGGMGTVFEGENVRIRRKVAIKVLLAAVASNADLIRRFEREAQAAGEIGSDHILEVLDLGTLPTGERYMVMEYLDGETLAARIRKYHHLSPRQVALLVRQLLSGLASAHAAGIIHRDLKPDNVFIVKEKAGQRDFVKLIDFGISKFSRLNADPLHVTRAGTMMGTPFYISPEQARGVGEADVRSDIYAVGVMLYEAVTGRVPFDAESFNDLMFKIALSDAPAPSTLTSDIDPAFEQIISKAMQRDPANRYTSVSEMQTAIDAWLAQPTVLSSTLAGVGGGLPAVDVPVRAPQAEQGAQTLLDPMPQTRVNWAAHSSSVDDAADPLPDAKRRTWIIRGSAVAFALTIASVLLAIVSGSPPETLPKAAAAESAAPSASALVAPPSTVAPRATIALEPDAGAVPPGAVARKDDGVARPLLPRPSASVVVKPAHVKPTPSSAASSRRPAPDFGY